MAQHFLLSAQARTLSLKAIYQAGDDEAYETFCRLRWPDTDGCPQCPRCACTKAYHLSTRRRFKCAACHHQFSVTSGTIFACRKLSFVDLLAAICLFVNAAKGASALQLSRDLDVQYKTAFVLAHKLREALAAETAELKLNNTVEVDGAYFGGHVRRANLKADRVDQHHRVEATKLDAYAAHAGWLEDHRRQSNGELADRLMRSVLAAPVSGTWSGYWQRAA